IKSNFKEGLTVLEYFISTNGARKGLADTALKTADAGYLTRRLVDIAQDVVITMVDCGTSVGIDVIAIKEGDEVIESIGSRALGRTLLYDLYHPVTNESICNSGELITEDIAEKIDELGLDRITIRSALTCEARHGVCARCYGRNLATSRMVDIGEAVGIIAAQSIGQPGTQLTMRTFHIGGTASHFVEESEISFNYPVYVKETTFKTVKTEDDKGEKKTISVRRGYIIIQRLLEEISAKNGDILINNGDRVYSGTPVVKKPDGSFITTSKAGIVKLDKSRIYILGEQNMIPVNIGSTIYCKADKIYPVDPQTGKTEVLVSFDPWFEPILTEINGKVKFIDIEINKSMREEIDPLTHQLKRIIVETKTEKLQPAIEISSADELFHYLLPKGAHLFVDDGMSVKAGTVLAKIPKEVEKTRDITGGLPRVAELFEARTPKEKATISEIDGYVKIGDTVKNKRKIIITAEDGDFREYQIPASKYLRVQDADWINKGDKIDDGPIDPHDILDIKGPRELEQFLVNEIQEVYRLQGVQINDKHIEIIVRQMLRKVIIEDPGDTSFVVDQIVDKFEFDDENIRVEKEGGKAASAKPVLMGITKSALNTESFISAASFQETTRVLTEAAIKGKIDRLRGLKENVIIGHLIPAGTGVRDYNRVTVYQKIQGDLDGVVKETEEEIPVEK
ncbi:MAG TPA: DNA-directed RNA polymerase subunit beta', partial [Spirochaetota bacterium]|nr:DNA-directed RNA polymerase subunit beta' [Spirochaetota bacterium]